MEPVSGSVFMTTRTVSELAEICGASLEGDGDRIVVGPASLEEASEDQVSFLGNPRYAPELETTRAGAVLLAPNVRAPREDLALLRHPRPNEAFTRIIEEFLPRPARPEAGVHPTATVSPDATLGEGVWIGPQAVVGPGAQLGEGVVVHALACVGADVHVGDGSTIHPSVVLYDGVTIGRRCIVHAGSIVGADGFGFDPGPEGWEKIPQCGTVVVEDDVELGACVTIDRGRFGATRIGRGAKLDNQVHVGHNVTVGAGSLLIAQVGIAGSTTVGEGVILAGQVGVTGHLRIGDRARVSAQSGVTKSLEGGMDYLGTPARSRVESLRLLNLVRRLPAFQDRIRRLESRLAELEGERAEGR